MAKSRIVQYVFTPGAAGIGNIQVPGKYDLQQLLVITNTTKNIIIYNFADSNFAGTAISFSRANTAAFPQVLQNTDGVTTITLAVDTSTMSSTDTIQIFFEAPFQFVKQTGISTDAFERQRVSPPQSMLDADFEYGLQPTKWQTLDLMRGYPSIYEIPGTDTAVLTVTTDASSGTGGTGESLITITTVSAHGFSVGTPITVKGYLNTILGFSRAEGTFVINTVPTTNSLTYYAKAKVGVNNGDLLSSAYTQLRKGGFYSGASIGSPSFSVNNSNSPSTITVTFLTAHGLVPSDTITVTISSSGTNHQYAAGPFFVESVPTNNTLTYTARATGTIDTSTTLTGIVYARPDCFYVHRPFDGGVQLGTGGPAHGAQAIRMSKKYIRYQSGKAINYNTGLLLAPSYDIRSFSASGLTVGATVTVTTDDTDHGLQVGAIVTITGCNDSAFNGTFTVTGIVDERNFQYVTTSVPSSTTPSFVDPCTVSLVNWYGSTVRAGTYDEQNGQYWQYDGQTVAVGYRSSTFQTAGTITATPDSNSIVGSNTRFLSQLAEGDRIVIKGMTHVVSSVVSDTQIYVTPDYRGANGYSGVKAVKTIDKLAPQSQWNIDRCDGSNGPFNPSGYKLNVSKMQMVGVQWTWYGAGFIDWQLRGPEGNYITVHRIKNSNVNTEAYMRSGNQPVRYEVSNEGPRTQTTVAAAATDTTLTVVDASLFPSAGTIWADGELITYTGKTTNTLTGLTRSSSFTQFAAGSSRTFSGNPASVLPVNTGLILIGQTATPNVSHWGSAFLTDGGFDNDRGYIFNYAATGVTASGVTNTAFLIRLAPSVSNAITGDLGDRELLNRAQMLLENISITSDSVSGGGAIVIQGVLNPSNYPTNPTNITWTSLNTSAAGGQPSFAQVASGGSVNWGASSSTSTATIQGAFTTTITARSFDPATNSLTAVGFAPVVQTVSAPAVTAVQNGTYQYAFNSTRNDFLITQASYAALTTPIAVGDTLSVATYIAAGQTVASVTPSYITINGVLYARIVMSANANATSATNTAIGAIAITSSVAAVYNSALSTGRSDFLITQSAYASSTIALNDVLSASTYITGSQTISRITPSYTTIAGTSYARITMSAAGNATSTAGANNVSVTSTSAATATYGSALSTGRTDFLVTDSDYAASGILLGDPLSLSTYITGGQTISAITTGYIVINTVSYTRIVMSAAANATSTSGASNSQSVTVTAQGSAASYTGTNYLFFTGTSWLASGASVGTKLATSVTSFPANTGVAGIQARTFASTTVYRVTFTQSSNTTLNAAGTITFQFGSAYALPGEQVFSFISNPGNTDSLDLSALKEMTSTAIGGRGTFPNGPDVLAINIFKVSGTNTNVNLILRWGEAQA